MRATGNRARLSLIVVAGGLALASCVDESVTYEDRGLYGPGVEAAGGFIGYADPSDDDKLTVCGYCHGTVQAQWEQTAHASAWEGLQSSDHVQPVCEGCHTVNSLGNIVPEGEGGAPVGGHASAETSNGRYLDVQCESCHGPGITHATDPSKGNRPLAPVQVRSSLTRGCGECHNGVHHPFVEEWETSPHGNVNPVPATDQEDGCASCHSGEGALLRLGVTADYLEKDSLLASDAAYAQIACAVCHDPHSKTNPKQLRFPVESATVDNHLCAQCHDRQSQPNAAADNFFEFRPHSPETAELKGTAGYFPATASIGPGTITGPHGISSNPRLCASCHVVPYTVEDPASGETFTSTGHGFRAAPCVGPNGLPSGEEDCVLTTTARSFKGCVSGECHAGEAEAQATLVSAIDRVLPLVTALYARLNQVDPNGNLAGGAIDFTDGVLTVADGAYFNLALALYPGSITSRTSPETIRGYLAPSVTHNPALIEALLRASLEALDATYGPSPGAAALPTSATDR